MISRAVLALAVPLVAACGARTGLELPPFESDGSFFSEAGSDDTSADGFDATDSSANADARRDSIFDSFETLDATVDAPEDVLALSPPRPMAPISTSRTTTRRPTFRWTNATGETAARVEICANRACTSIVSTYDATGSSVRAFSDLPVGVIFWRLRTIRPGAVGATTSATWELVVPARSAPVESSQGALADFDGDGLADVAVAVGHSFDGYTIIDAELTVHRAITITAGPFVWTPPSDENRFGWDLAAVGDLDGDGFGDLVLTGRTVYVFPGSSTGPSSTPQTIDVGLPSDPPHEAVVRASAGGDVDGDGYGELVLIVSPDGATPHVEVHRGGPSGVDVHATWRIDTPFGTKPESAFAAGCDVDADGFSDVLLAAVDEPCCDDRLHFAFYRGGSAGPPATPTATFVPYAAPTPDVSWGIASLACAGDVDADGYGDFWISTSAPMLYGGSSSGPTSTPRGLDIAQTGIFSSGLDIDADGFLDLVVASGSDAPVFVSGGAPIGKAPTERLAGSFPPGFGSYVAALGDVDGDGFGDCAVAAGPNVDLFHGSSAGFGAPPWTPWRVFPESQTVLGIATSR